MLSRIALSVIFFTAIAAQVSAQDITGSWEGNYQKNIFMATPSKLVVELSLSRDSVLNGATHLYYPRGQYEHYKITGIYHSYDSTLRFSEDTVIALHLGDMLEKCMGLYRVKLSVSDTAMRLDGTWRDKDRRFLHCPTTGVWLVKKLTKKDLRILVPGDSLIEPADTNLRRAGDIQSIIEVVPQEKDSIKIEVYDNGIIDNDSISLYFNDSVLVRKHMIDIKPLTYYISIDKKTPINKIRLAAESLGSIPPCTALMVITTRKTRYEVDLSSDFNRNAVVEFFLKE